jgi:hypothetical protein
MDLISHDLIVIMRVYIDDIVIKSAARTSLLANLRLAFGRMHLYGLKMNPLKYVSVGKFGQLNYL